MSRGNIRERAKGSYTITIELPRDCITNKRKQKYFNFKGTKKEAQIFLTEKLREIDTGILIDTKNIKFSEYLDYWMEEYCNNKLRINTIEGYKHYIENHIKPVLGNIELEKITPLHLQTLYSNKLKHGRLKGEGGLSKKSVLTIHRIIHCALERAVKWQFVSRNVADNVEPPKAEQYQAKFLNDKQIKALMEIAVKTEIYIPIIIGIYTGMRRGEILDLIWDNVNLERGYIRISPIEEGDLKSFHPKTKDSIRTIAIPDFLIKILKKHKTKQMENKLRLGNEYINSNAVCTYENGKLFNPKRFSSKFHKLLVDNNLPHIRFHDLRHSHASLLVKLGIHPKVISERLGHSDIGITMNLYSHLYEDTDREVADMFDNLINSKQNKIG